VVFLGLVREASSPKNKMARGTKSSKAKILEQQSSNKKKTNEIAAMVQHLRMKPDWISKISDPTIREKYCQEAVEQGISLENAHKALSILETMAQCQPQRSPLSSSAAAPEEPIELIVRVGETNFSTTTKILTADSESMLSRMFSSSWLSGSQKEEPIHIETTSNSPVLFALILSYLTALNEHNYSELCPDLGTGHHSVEQIDALLADCDYLGLRRLAIAVSVQLMSAEMTVAEEQKRLSEKLLTVSRQLKMARDEKVAIEKRLLELPALIQRLEEEEVTVEQERLRPVTRMRLQAGDHVMVNTSGRTWLECSLVEAEEAEEEHRKTRSKGKGKDKKQSASSSSTLPPPQLLAKPMHLLGNRANNLLPLPGRAFYHPVSLVPEQHFHSPIFSRDHFLPEPLSQSLEEHLDGLLHEKALDLHPGSDGQVVDLIHPSLFPFISGGVSRVDKEELAKCVPVQGSYSWLPAEFLVDESGRVTIESYINNLDQEAHPELYFDIAQVFQAILPLFETTLSKKLRSRALQVIVKAAYYFIPPGETYEGE
jgi:hypothetical protein